MESLKILFGILTFISVIYATYHLFVVRPERKEQDEYFKRYKIDTDGRQNDTAFESDWQVRKNDPKDIYLSIKCTWERVFKE